MPKNKRHIKVLPFSVSQNFLTSSKTINRLLRRTSIGKDDYVIEIGAGKGHITRNLIKICRAVGAYEIDKGLYSKLLDRIGDMEGLSIKCQDFLSAPLPERSDYKVFSNIPFSVTTQIVKKLITARNPPQEAWLIMEKGAAKRFMGKPVDTAMSLIIKPFFDTKIIYHFSKHDFHPMPSVDIVLVHFIKKAQPDIPMEQQKLYMNFLEICNKQGVFNILSKNRISTALKLAKLPSIKPSGTVLYIQWLCLFRCYLRGRK